MLDGSGLSPQNRVTANAEVMALQYAKTRPWYNSFYTSLPVYNGIKMKSGSIGGSKAFAGYHVSAGGVEYIFSIIINNYDGPATYIVQKMYGVLNVLK
jgi:D-alanyl-D-alanine carboxypeptidase/D-alanyl-D-alanine-endopeptidase (penicillin-binding protein 4)